MRENSKNRSETLSSIFSKLFLSLYKDPNNLFKLCCSLTDNRPQTTKTKKKRKSVKKKSDEI